MLVATNFLPAAIKTPEQAVAIILTGRELGIPTMAALRSIDVIQGKPTVSPQLMLALINRSGQLETMELSSADDGVLCLMKRKGRRAHTAKFGPAQAKALGLDGKDNYKKQAQTMYQWRAVAACARAVFPDVILGLYTHDGMGATVDAESGELADLPAPVRSLHAAPAPESMPRVDEVEAYARLGAEMESELNALAEDAPQDDSAPTADTRETLEAEIKELIQGMGYTKRALDGWIQKKYDVPDGLAGLHLDYMNNNLNADDAMAAFIEELIEIRDHFKAEAERAPARQ